MTRTEAFLQWVHDHSGEVVAITDAQIDRDVARLAREEQEQRARMMPARVRKSTDAQLRRRIKAHQSAVPF